MKPLVSFWPNLTLPHVRLVTEVVRVVRPVPLSVTCFGLVKALSLIVSDALCAPIVLGVNATANVHDTLGASITGIAPHVPAPVSAYSESDVVALAIINGLVAPVLVTVAFF